MIKLLSIEAQSDAKVLLRFSDGSKGIYCARSLIAEDTVLTRPLAEPTYFAGAFVEAGALAWPNGLELAPWTLHAELREAGALVEARVA